MIRLLWLAKPYRTAALVVLALAFVQSTANLYLPTLMADIVDIGIVNNDTDYILKVGGLMLAIAFGGTICAVVGSYFAAKIAIGFGRIMRRRIFAQA